MGDFENLMQKAKEQRESTEVLKDIEPVDISATSNWLEDTKETIILFGASKVGKTFGYLGVIESELRKDPEKRFYIINTDGGVARSFKEYFKDKAKEVSKSVEYYFVSDIKQAISALNKIRKKATGKDWIIMDLLSDFWEMAQDEFIKQTGGDDVTDLIIKASKNDKKFGLFDSLKWQYIKKLDNEMTYVLPSRPICNVLGVCAEKDLEIEKIRSAKTGGTEMVNLYQDLMVRPAGQKQITYKFNTILYITGMNKKNVTVFGDRGKLKLGSKFTYEKNLWEAFLQQRNES